MSSPHRPRLPRSVLIALVFPLLAAGALAQGNGWLLLDPTAGDAVLSADPHEKSVLLEGPWEIDASIRFLAPTDPRAHALHRLAKAGPQRTSRRMSTDPAEVAALVKDGFMDEGVVGFVATEAGEGGLLPVTRYSKAGENIWLADSSDAKWAEAAGWKSEGPVFWVEAAPIP